MNTSVLHNLCLVESSDAEQWMWRSHGGWRGVADYKSYVDFQLYGGSVLLTPELIVQGSNVLVSGKIRLYNRLYIIYIYIYIIQQYITERNNKIKYKFLR